MTWIQTNLCKTKTVYENENKIIKNQKMDFEIQLIVIKTEYLRKPNHELHIKCIKFLLFCLKFFLKIIEYF